MSQTNWELFNLAWQIQFMHWRSIFYRLWPSCGVSNDVIATKGQWVRLCVGVQYRELRGCSMGCATDLAPFNVAAKSHSTCSSVLREHADGSGDYSWNSQCLSSGLCPSVRHTRPSLPGCIKQVSNSSNYSHIYPNNASLIAPRFLVAFFLTNGGLYGSCDDRLPER